MKYLLLLAPCILAVLTPLYNGIDPALFGIPLFYWFQLLLIPVSALARNRGTPGSSSCPIASATSASRASRRSTQAPA